MNELALAAGVVAACGAGRLLYRLIFDDPDDFLDCVKFSFTPDLFSLFRGKYLEDMAQSFELGAWVLLTGGAGVEAYHGVAAW